MDNIDNNNNVCVYSTKTYLLIYHVQTYTSNKILVPGLVKYNILWKP